jgi:hypothetical protein
MTTHVDTPLEQQQRKTVTPLISVRDSSHKLGLWRQLLLHPDDDDDDDDGKQADRFRLHEAGLNKAVSKFESEPTVAATSTALST